MNQPLDTAKSSKIIIRIKVPSAADSAAISNNHSNKTLIWLALVIVCILAVAGWYWLSGQELVVNEIQAENKQPAIEAVEPIQSQSPEKAQITPVEQPVSVIANETVETSKLMAKAEAEIAPTSEVSQDRELDLKKELSQSSEIKVIPETETETETETKTEITSEIVAERPELASQETVKQEPVIKSDIVDLEKNVARATFAHDIKNREPVNLIEEAIVAKPEGLKRVYFFSELRNMKGRKVLHRWIYNGKKQSDVAFNVGGNRWRIYSSKRIISSKTGQWQVDVVDQESQQIIATRQFNYGQ